jgi:hypothetical protein
MTVAITIESKALKLSAVAAGHTIAVKQRYYEKADFEEVHKSFKEYHPAFTQE